MFLYYVQNGILAYYIYYLCSIVSKMHAQSTNVLYEYMLEWPAAFAKISSIHYSAEQFIPKCIVLNLTGWPIFSLKNEPKAISVTICNIIFLDTLFDLNCQVNMKNENCYLQDAN